MSDVREFKLTGHFKVRTIDGSNACIYFEELEDTIGVTVGNIIDYHNDLEVMDLLGCDDKGVMTLFSHNLRDEVNAYGVKCTYREFIRALEKREIVLEELDLIRLNELGIFRLEDLVEGMRKGPSYLKNIQLRKRLANHTYGCDVRNYRLGLREELFKKVAEVANKYKVTTDSVINNTLELNKNNLDEAASLAIVNGENKLIEMLENNILKYNDMEINFSYYEIEEGFSRDRVVKLFDDNNRLITRVVVDLLKL